MNVSVVAACRVIALLATVIVLSACSGQGDGDDGIILSGALSVPGFVLTDADVNDVNVSLGDNNSVFTAQEVPNPVNVGGYVNIAGKGAAGSTFASGDVSDYYKVELEAGQSIVLNIADSDIADLDLALFDETILSNPNAEPVARSFDLSKFESISVSQSGTYFLQVYVYPEAPLSPLQRDWGHSNYLLSIGLTPTLDAQTFEHREQADFVTGELVAKPLAVATSKFALTASKSGLRVKQQSQSGAVLMQIDPVGNVSNALATQASAPVDDIRLRKATLRAIDRLRASGDYEYVQPNYRRHAMAVPDDTYYGYQWHYPMINLPAAWDVTTGNASAVVAVVDTGVLLNHPDLQGQLVSGYDFISDPAGSGDRNGIDNNPDDPGDGGIYNASSFHGTHVAGTIAASSNNDAGVAGVAWGAKVMPLRVLGERGGTDYDIAQAIRYAAGLSNDSNTVPAKPADIINLSLGGPDGSQVLASAIAAAQQAGVIVIAAAGNENTSRASYPAAFSGVVSVSAVDINRELAPYSNFGTTIDVAAPGGDTTQDLNGDGRGDGVLSTAGDDSSGTTRFSYAIYQGTSMAAPHVAGVAALMKSVYPGLTPSQFTTALQSGAITRDLGDGGRDNAYGYGLIDAYKAVQEAQRLAGGTGTAVNPDIMVNPQSISFGLVSSTATLYVDEIGNGDLAINSVVPSAAWLTATEDTVDNLGFGSYRLAARRSDLPAGTYQATLTVTASNAGASVVVTESIEVLIQVLDSSVTGSAGLAYVLLVDADTDEVLEQLEIDAQAGSATFRFTNLSTGNYLVFAGSDMNNDSTICDTGEACGAYPTEDRIQAISVEESQSGIDFLFTYPYESPVDANGAPDERRQGYRLKGKSL